MPPSKLGGKSLLVLAVAALGLSLATVSLATFLPALRTSQQEPAVAMRE